MDFQANKEEADRRDTDQVTRLNTGGEKAVRAYVYKYEWQTQSSCSSKTTEQRQSHKMQYYAPDIEFKEMEWFSALWPETEAL